MTPYPILNWTVSSLSVVALTAQIAAGEWIDLVFILMMMAAAGPR